MDSDILIEALKKEDIPTWMDISNEYDDYVRELVPDLTQWYKGNGYDISFAQYMENKINQSEAFMASAKKVNKCLGIVAFSKSHNRITFFAISHYTHDYYLVGNILMNHALNQLDRYQEITINVLKSKAKHIEKQRGLMKKLGFICIASELENGVPVDKLVKRA